MLWWLLELPLIVPSLQSPLSLVPGPYYLPLSPKTSPVAINPPTVCWERPYLLLQGKKMIKLSYMIVT